MSNESIAKAFGKGKAFIPFVTAGDPDMATTAAVVRALVRAGAAIVELGVPFSDPTAEGPVIQGANIRSLAGGTTTDQVFQLVSALRSGEEMSIGDALVPAGEPVEVPIVLMTYANVVFHYGCERFCERAAKAGVDGLILPDVPYEEHEEFEGPCNDHGIALVPLIAPTSEERIAEIASAAEGFIYLVSSMGVTGMRTEITTDLDSIVAKIREVCDTPIAIGFGVSTPEQAKTMASTADGAIMGSALVRIIGEEGAACVPTIEAFAGEVTQAVTSAN